MRRHGLSKCLSLNLCYFSIFYDSADFLLVTFSIFHSSVGRVMDSRMTNELFIDHWVNFGSKEFLVEKYVGIYPTIFGGFLIKNSEILSTGTTPHPNNVKSHRDKSKRLTLSHI